MPRLSTGFARAMLDRAFNGGTVAALFDAGVLRFYSGARPADPNDAPTGALLAELALAADSFGASAASGNNERVSIPATISDPSANATGAAGYARLSDAADAGGVSTTEPRLDYTVSATSGGGEIELVSTAITATQPVQITALHVDLPRGL